MIKVIERATTERELIETCNKYRIVIVPQPIMLFSRIGDILCKKNNKERYAVCDSDAVIELVDFDTQDNLVKYCHDNNFTFVSIVYPDGSGMVLKL